MKISSRIVSKDQKKKKEKSEKRLKTNVNIGTDRKSVV